MKVEYITLFIAASIEMIDQITGLKPTIGKIYTKNSPYKSDNLVVLIGITGGFHGSVVMSFSKVISCKIASVMMGI